MDTIIHLFVRSVSKYEGKIAFSYFDGTWKELTYKTFLTYVRAIASYLVKSGMEPGSRVAIAAENRLEWCASYLGIVMAGGIAVPIDANLGPAEIGNLVDHSGAFLLFHSDRTAGNPAGSTRRISFDSPEFKGVLETPEIEFFPVVTADDTASIVYTSGTTANPKGVVLTHGNYCSDAEALIRFGILRTDDNVLALLPFHHAYPFLCTFLVPVFVGASMTFPKSLKGPEMMATVRERRVTIFMAVPQLIEILRSRIINGFREKGLVASSSLRILMGVSKDIRKTTGLNLGRMIFGKIHKTFGDQFRFFASGGARLDPRVMEDLEGIGFTVLEGYGLTETSPVVTFNPLERRKPGSAGKPLPSVEIKILNPPGKREGEVAVRGPMVMKGYYRDPRTTEEAFYDGWFLTGDLGYLDREGYLFITGRKKEVIVLRSGMNIFPEEVEREYLEIALIKEIGVLAVEGGGGTESLFGMVVPNLDYAREGRIGNLHETLKDEIGRISQSLPSHMRLKGFAIQKEPLPRTPLGKLKRYAMKELTGKTGKMDENRKQEEKGEEGLTGDSLAMRIDACLKVLLEDKRPIRLSDHLELDLGLDSLKRIELVASLEKAFSLKLPEDFLSEVQTVRDVVLKIKQTGSSDGQEMQAVDWKEIFVLEPSEEEKRKIHLGDEGLSPRPLAFILKCLRTFLKFFFNFEVRGIENLPSPPFIIAPNHLSYLDGFVVAAAVGPAVFGILYFLGYQPYFKGPVLSAFARLAHIIPVDAEGYLLKALRLSSLILRHGGNLCVFPEGGRSYDGTIMEFKKGVSILARNHRVPVVPARILGTFQVLPRGAIIPRLRSIKIIFGEPLRTDLIDSSGRGEGVDEDRLFAEILREGIKRLK